MEWELLPKNETDHFLEMVKNDKFPELFDIQTLELHRAPLSFYEGGYLYVLQNYSVLPEFSLCYLKAGDNIAYLDGSAAPCEAFNRKGLLKLSESSAIDYLQIFCIYVIQRPNNVLLLKNPEDMPFTGDYYIDFHFDKNNYGEKDIVLERNPAENSYIVHGPFVFDGKIDPATATISDAGGVHIERRENA